MTTFPSCTDANVSFKIMRTNLFINQRQITEHLEILLFLPLSIKMCRISKLVKSCNFLYFIRRQHFFCISISITSHSDISYPSG